MTNFISRATFGLGCLVSTAAVATASADTHSSNKAVQKHSISVSVGYMLGMNVSDIPICDTEEAIGKNCIYPERAGSNFRYFEFRPDRPSFLKSNLQLTAETDGTVSSVVAETKGLTVTDEAMGLLRAAYGKPNRCNESAAQNSFGASVKVIECLWNLKDGQVYFRNVSDRVDAGTLSLTLSH